MEDRVRNICIPPDANAILSIPLPAVRTTDQIAWHHEPTGVFLVRGAYRLALTEHCQSLSHGQGSNQPDGNRPIWDLLWCTDVQPKIKIFGWKLATNSLAVQENRARRLPNVLPICQICGSEAENGFHAIMRCPRSRALRAAMRSFWELPPEKLLQFSGKDGLISLLASVDKHTRARLLMLWWRAWHHRNNIIFNNGDCPIQASVSLLLGLSPPQPADPLCAKPSRGKALVLPLPASSNGPPRQAVTWSRPPLGWIKLNVDASFIEDLGTGTWGAILRDHASSTIGAAWASTFKCRSADEAEALAARDNLRSLQHLISGPVCLESDCLSLTRELALPSTGRSPISLLAAEMVNLLRTFQDFSICKTPRSANGAAHGIDAYARLGVSPGVLTDSVPDVVSLDRVEPCNDSCCN